MLYLPVIKNNDKLSKTIDKNTTTFTDVPVGGYLITADYTTSDPSTFATSADATAPFRTDIGIFEGNRTFATSGRALIFDQGIDNVNDLSVASLGASDPLKRLNISLKWIID